MFRLSLSLRKLFLSILFAGILTSVSAQDSGAEIFDNICKACHTVGQGRLVGPDLRESAQKRAPEWFVDFVQSSQTMVAKGDPEAVAVFEAYNRIVMPDNALSDEQALAVFEYIKTPGLNVGILASPTEPESGQSETAKSTPPPSTKTATAEDIDLGRNLFQGIVRLEAGGPSCISCHDVTHDAVIGGGILAKDLTTVFSRMGAPGVKAIIGSSPFPVMQQAYKGKALASSEIFALVAFLEEADRQHALHQPRDYGIQLFLSGLSGCAILLLLYSLIWRHRKLGTVNREIFARQLKSQ